MPETCSLRDLAIRTHWMLNAHAKSGALYDRELSLFAHLPRRGIFSATEFPVEYFVKYRRCRHCAFGKIPTILPYTSKSAYYYEALIANRRCALASTLSCIYPMQKGIPEEQWRRAY